MAIKKDTTSLATTSALRRCIGSTTFGIDAHEATYDDFPVQASGKDGLGRMCRPHWTEYTRALRKASVASKSAGAEPAPEPIVGPEATIPRMGRRAKAAPEPEAIAG